MHVTRKSDNLKAVNGKHNFFKNSLFLSVINEICKLDLKTRDSATSEFFLKKY